LSIPGLYLNGSDGYFLKVLLCGAYNTILNVKSAHKTTNVNFRKRKRRKIPRKLNGEVLTTIDFTKKFINTNKNKINDFTRKFRNAKKNKINDFTRKFRNTKKNNNKIVILKINDFTRKVRNTNNKKIVLNSENHLITIKMLSI
jgi:hypothetical protein